MKVYYIIPVNSRFTGYPENSKSNYIISKKNFDINNPEVTLSVSYMFLAN